MKCRVRWYGKENRSVALRLFSVRYRRLGDETEKKNRTLFFFYSYLIDSIGINIAPEHAHAPNIDLEITLRLYNKNLMRNFPVLTVILRDHHTLAPSTVLFNFYCTVCENNTSRPANCRP